MGGSDLLTQMPNLNEEAEENTSKLPAQGLQEKSDSAVISLSNGQSPQIFSLHVRTRQRLYIPQPPKKAACFALFNGEKLFKVLSFPCQLLPSSKFYKER